MSQPLPYAEVIGDPVAHSKSPTIHNFWLRELGIEAEYRKTHVKAGELAGYFLRRRADPDWLGCNITIPHKIAALDYVDDPGGVRERIGAINTVACETGGPLIGTNTDAGGFLQPLLREGWTGSRAIMVGAGGAALAIAFALRSVGITDLTIVARDAAKGAALLARLGFEGRVQDFDAPLPGAELLVNASPLGMTGHAPYAPDLAALSSSAMVYDIVYAPLETPLLRAARARGLATLDGMEMLIGQAALAFDIFFDAAAPREQDGALRELLLAPAEHALMAHRPFRLGLTGSIGMGKSTVAAVARRMGVPVFDADAAVHALQGPGGALVGPIERRFPGTTGPHGVDRRALGARVIGNPSELAALEAIVHPAVAACRQAFLRRHAGHRLVLLDIPLLFETGLDAQMDAVAVVSAPGFLQRRRVLRRPGMTRARLQGIVQSQLPDHMKRAGADILIETGRPRWRTSAQVSRLLACLRAAQGR